MPPAKIIIDTDPAIGPLSNVAAAGLLDPGFYGNVSRIVMMGGAFSSGPFGPLPLAFEFNFFKDPAAVRGGHFPCRLPESVDARGLLEEFLSVIEGSGRPAA